MFARTRTHTVTSRRRPGISAHDALQAKYGEKFDEDTAVKEVSLGSNNQAISVEIIGVDKAYEQQSQLNTLKEIYLQDTPINGPGTSDPWLKCNLACTRGRVSEGSSWVHVGVQLQPQLPAYGTHTDPLARALASVIAIAVAVAIAGIKGALQATVPSVQILDLSKTLLSKWETVFEVTQELPNLRTLRLCKNRLALAPPDAAASTADKTNPAPLTNLKGLFLNQSLPTFADVRT